MRWNIVAEASDADALRSEFASQDGVTVVDEIATDSGVIGLLEADTARFPLDRFDLVGNSIRGVSLYRDEQHARNVVKRLTGG